MIKLRQIVIPVAIGVGIMVAIRGLIEVNNALVPILAEYEIYIQHINQLNSKDIAIVGSLVGVIVATLFGVVLSKDDEDGQARQVS